MVSQLETRSIRPLHGDSPDESARFPHCIEGTIQVFTCPHRSFFSNVMAQALRIAGQGTPVLVVQFLKGGIGQGIEHPVKLGQHLDWLRCNLSRCVDTPDLEAAEALELEHLWQHTQDVVRQEKYTLVVLDELSLAINFGLISEAEVVAFLQQRPIHIDVVLTGPDMPAALLNMADQVTQLRRCY
ncbi:MAG: P-loop NTPase family protein [Cyanothece sp. SIO1E1]|nr:P-loop NTPase family protein [Cyanothece sp. SIO1E1]